MNLSTLCLHLSLFLVFYDCAKCVAEEEFIGPIRKCRKGTDEEVNACFGRILTDLKPKLAAGVPEIGLQPLDPFQIQKLKFSQGRGALVIKALFSNITVRHFSEFENGEFKINSREKRLNFFMDVPKLRLDGTYSLEGKVLLFPLGGTGPYWIELGGVVAQGFCGLEVAEDESHEKFVQVDKVHLELTIRDIKVQLLNLFNGNPVLGPVVNNVLNENAQDLFKEMKPEIVKVVSNIVMGISNSIIKNMSFLVPIVE